MIFPEFLVKYSKISKYFIPCFVGKEVKESVNSSISAPDFPHWFIHTVSAKVDNLINIANTVVVLKAKKTNITPEFPS